MKKILFLVLVSVTVICLSGCQKKQDTLEEMQQPMAPEDLSRLSSENQASAGEQKVEAVAQPSVTQVPAAISGAQATTQSVSSEIKLENLPPGGPYPPKSLEIQAALKNAGFYSGIVDGKLGPLTKKAIEDFQKQNNLKVDGKVGPKTWELLIKFLNVTPAPAGKTKNSTAKTTKKR